MQLVGSRGQFVSDRLFDLSGTITTGGTPQLLLPQAKSRSVFYFVNLSAVSMWVEFGSAQATATLSSGVLSAITVTNGGFGFLKPPSVAFYGGGNVGEPGYLGAGLIGTPQNANNGAAHCVLTAGVVTSIVIDNPGKGYLIAPQVVIANDPLDPLGCADPSLNAGMGFIVPTLGTLKFDTTYCPTQQCAVFCGTSASRFTMKFAP